MRKTIEKRYRFCLYSKVISQVKERKYQQTNRTRNIIQTFSFQKIKSDFDFDHPFGRYGCLKICTTCPILVLFPKYLENRIFPKHAVFTKMCPLLSFMILNCFQRKLKTKFSVKLEKLRKMALFTTFSQITGPPDFFSKIRKRYFS